MYFCTWWRHVGIHPPMNCRAFLWQKPFCVFTLSANQCLLANLFITADDDRIGNTRYQYTCEDDHYLVIALKERAEGYYFTTKGRFGIDSDTSLQGIWFLSRGPCSYIVIMRDIDCFILENFTTWHIEYIRCVPGHFNVTRLWCGRNQVNTGFGPKFQ